MADAGNARDRRAARAERTRLALMRVWIAVGAIVVAAAVLNVLGVLAPVVEFLAVGSLVAFVASPIVNVLEHRGVPRSLAALLGVVAVIAVVVLVIAIILPIFFEQVLEILTRLPQNLRGLQAWFNDIAGQFSALASSEWRDQINAALTSVTGAAADFAAQVASDIGRGIVPVVGGLASTLFVVFLGLVLSFWLACDYPRIHAEVGRILGDDKDDDYRVMVAILSRSVGGYMRGMFVTSVVNGVLVFAGLAAAGHPYAALMGVLAGVLHLVPVIGPWVSSAAAVLIALFSGPALALWTLAVTVVAQNVTDNVISPKVMQSTVQVHPAMSLTAIVVGSALLGPLGMVVAIPLCAALKGLFVFYFESTTSRQLVSYDGAIFKGRPYLDADGRPVPAFDALGDDTFVADSEIVSEGVVPAAQAAPKPEPEAVGTIWDKMVEAGRAVAQGRDAEGDAGRKAEKGEGGEPPRSDG